MAFIVITVGRIEEQEWKTGQRAKDEVFEPERERKRHVLVSVSELLCPFQR